MKFINIFLNRLNNMDVKIQSITKKGIFFSNIITLLSLFILIIYDIIYSSPILFYIGIDLFKSSLTFAIMFFICGIGFDTIQKDLL